MERTFPGLPSDVHTHRRGNPDALYSAGTEEAIRLHAEEGNTQPYSLALHPWDLVPNRMGWIPALPAFLEALEACDGDSRMLALGECGFDPRCPLDGELQQQVFETVLDMARERSLPVVVHCVSMWDALYRSVAHVWGARQAAAAWDAGCPVIVHGFRKGPQLALQLAGKGYGLSFGEHFNARALRAVPPHLRFAETDESLLSIEQIKALHDQCISQT